jgi:hypothetical protein
MAIQKQSVDPDVEAAATTALDVIDEVLTGLKQAETFDYGGHMMRIGEYGVCPQCTSPIAEAQQAQFALQHRAEKIDDPAVREHVDLASELMKREAEAAIIRAELHNGLGSEKIIDHLNKFKHDRHIHDEYSHSHHGGQA